MRVRWGAAAVAAGVIIGAMLVSAGRGDAAFPGDNGLLVYEETTKGPSGLYTVDPAGSGTGPTRFTDLDDATGPAWSPDGSRVAFDRYSDGNAGLWVVDADGAGLQRLTTAESSDGVTVRHYDPAWSPDGTQLALQLYTYDYGQNSAQTSIATVDAAPGATPTVIVPGTSGTRHGKPVWSPDGTRIAFVTGVVGTASVNEDIWTASPTGDDLQRVTSSGGYKATVDWSPDSSMLVYQHGRGEAAEIAVVNRDGGTPRFLTDNKSSERIPVWSPDGNRIAFVTDADGVTDEVRVMDVDGSNWSAPVAAPSDYYRIYTLDWQALEPPPEPTTTRPEEEEEDTTTSQRSTDVSGRSVTNPQLPTPVPEDSAPALFLDRTVTRTGTVVAAEGSNFPSLAVVTLRWEPGLGEVVVGAGVDGAFARTVLVMPRDTTGPRRLVASVDGETLAGAPLLVVHGPYQPSGAQRSLVTRR